jgi:competence protein ComEA
MKTWHHILLGVLLGLLISAVVYFSAVPPRGTPITLQAAPTPAPIVVDISGAVQRPGIYSMPRGSRTNEVIVAAGGVTLSADMANVNLAQLIRDGEKIHIPNIGDQSYAPISQNRGSGDTSDIAFPINLNTASLADLEALPGIGASRAQDIINYRETNGAFLIIEDIQKVPGIGPGTFERLRTLITVDN